MTGVEARLREAFAVTFDRQALLLAALFAVVLIPSVYLTVRIPFTVEPNTYGLEGATLGGAWVLAEVALAAALVGLILVFRYLPEWIRTWIRRSILWTLVMLIGAVGALTERFWTLAGFLVVFGFVIEALDEFDLWWMMNNVFVLAIVIAVAPLGAYVLGVEALIVGMVGLSVYDWYFADRKTWMMALATVAVKYYLPVMFIFPKRWRLDWNDLVDESEDGDLPDEAEEAENEPIDEAEISMGIGTADLLLPAMFAAAVAIEPTPFTVGGVSAAALGVGVGTLVASFRIRRKVIERESGAGLPPLATGALAGYAPFAVAAWVVTVL